MLAMAYHRHSFGHFALKLKISMSIVRSTAMSEWFEVPISSIS